MRRYFPCLRSFIVVIVLFIKITSSAPSSLTTDFLSQTSQNGNMFDIESVSSSDLYIYSMDLHVREVSLEFYEIYVKEDGFESGSSWKLQACAELNGMGQNIPSSLPEGGMVPILIKEGEVLGMYVTLKDFESHLYYSFGLLIGDVFVENDDLRIFQGVGVIYPFVVLQGQFARVWNGSIYYTIGNLDTTIISEISPNGDCVPSSIPSNSPTKAPSKVPTQFPTLLKSSSPSFQPSLKPSSDPSFMPSPQPTFYPTVLHTVVPTSPPTSLPTTIPTFLPTFSPTTNPTSYPTSKPTLNPTSTPTSKPTSSSTSIPTLRRSTPKPSKMISNSPTQFPSELGDTLKPTVVNSSSPTSFHTHIPSTSPTPLPTGSPSDYPTMLPTFLPTSKPTPSPTLSPLEPFETRSPTRLFSTNPSPIPSYNPSNLPSALEINSFTPTFHKSDPTQYPSIRASLKPTENPSLSQMPSISHHPSISSLPTFLADDNELLVVVACISAAIAVTSSVSSISASAVVHAELDQEVGQNDGKVSFRSSESLVEVRYFEPHSFTVMDEDMFRKRKSKILLRELERYRLKKEKLRIAKLEKEKKLEEVRQKVRNLWLQTKAQLDIEESGENLSDEEGVIRNENSEMNNDEFEQHSDEAPSYTLIA